MNLRYNLPRNQRIQFLQLIETCVPKKVLVHAQCQTVEYIRYRENDWVGWHTDLTTFCFPFLDKQSLGGICLFLSRLQPVFRETHVREMEYVINDRVRSM